MPNTLVSLIIPFHDRLELLDETIQSINKQTYRSIEIILVDDCSKHGILLDDYGGGHIPIRYFRNSENVGPARSRFIGLEHSHGDYIVFLDSDDILTSTFVERQVSTLESHKAAAFVYCFTKLFDNSGVVGERNVSQVSVNRILPGILMHGRIWCTSSCLWRKKCLLAAKPFGGYQWEDYRLEITVGLVHNIIACTPEYLCLCRIGHGENLSGKDNRKNAWIFESIHGILESIFSSKAKFSDLDLFVDKLLSKYITCLIGINDKHIFSFYYNSLLKIPFLSSRVSIGLPLFNLFPHRAKRVWLRLLKKEIKKGINRRQLESANRQTISGIS